MGSTVRSDRRWGGGGSTIESYWSGNEGVGVGVRGEGFISRDRKAVEQKRQ